MSRQGHLIGSTMGAISISSSRRDVLWYD